MIQEQIEILKKELLKLISNDTVDIDKLKDNVHCLMEISKEFGKNWVGQWASENYDVYKNFIKPSLGDYIRLNKDEIAKYVEKKTNLVVKDVNTRVFDILKKNQDFRDDLITELSIIKGVEGLNGEVDLLDNIENMAWGITAKEYVNQHKPKSVYTRNPEMVLNKGLQNPPHLSFDGELISFFSIISAIEDFQKNTKRLLRQLEIKMTNTLENVTKSIDSASKIYTLIDRFHLIANQLKNRHSKRNTLEISDEYDVQDLLNALLKIDFDDVRPEEYTPSYAGSSTRVDFLLKKENIIIEVKKTRNGLDDKEVGNQLILDSQHYKAHPDCKHLICFVYDPENRIKNPRGLESDLNKLTNEDLIVEVFIRP